MVNSKELKEIEETRKAQITFSSTHSYSTEKSKKKNNNKNNHT